MKSKMETIPSKKWIAEFWSDDCPILTFTLQEGGQVLGINLLVSKD
ncbi:MAG: hypothetical protein R2769_02620 [Saprospiraceae bacterium]